MRVRYIKNHKDIDGIQRSKGQEVKVLRAYAAELISEGIAEEVVKVRPVLNDQKKKKTAAKSKKKAPAKAK